MIDYLGATLTWRGRELSKYVEGNKQISYSYDVDGMRYQKIVKTSGVETSRYDYVYSDGKLILLTHTANGVANTARFIYDSFGEPRGFILNNSASYLYLKNGQGDITAIVDESGEILVRYTYNAWGAVEFIVPFGIDPAVTTVLATVSPFTYRGYCYDFDLGLYYLQSRYYDPEICRFINADSTDYLGATGTLLSYNLFAYCENDGVNFVDVTGTIYSYNPISRKVTGRFEKPAYSYGTWGLYTKNANCYAYALNMFVAIKNKNHSGKLQPGEISGRLFWNYKGDDIVVCLLAALTADLKKMGLKCQIYKSLKNKTQTQIKQEKNIAQGTVHSTGDGSVC